MAICYELYLVIDFERFGNRMVEVSRETNDPTGLAFREESHA